MSGDDAAKSEPTATRRALPRWLVRAASGAIAAGLDWLYPRRCLACEAETQSLGALCADCWAETAFVAEPLCRRCGAPLAFAAPGASAGAAARCPSCRDLTIRWRETRAATQYAGGARRLVLALKHGDRLEAARPMGRWMARAGAPLLAPDAEGRSPWLVPAPLHWRRRMIRKSNQAAALAAAVSRESGAPLAETALRRLRATPQLDGLSRAARAEALREAIAPSDAWSERIAGARAVLIDDVLTTGATLNACAEALQAMGARRVDALVFARVSRASETP